VGVCGLRAGASLVAKRAISRVGSILSGGTGDRSGLGMYEFFSIVLVLTGLVNLLLYPYISVGYC